MRIIFFLLLSFIHLASTSQGFRFAFISDTHIGSPNGSAEEDLRRTVRDINAMDDIAFVVLTGDITELGTNEELALAKLILDSLDIPYYIIPGNHDTGWSESGGVMFGKTFGSDRFNFTYGGFRFLGCASGPYVRMSDGHVPRDAVNWLDAELKKTKPGEKVIFLNHYPIDPGLDNWYEITDRLRKYNTVAILCGHGHTNRALNFEEIPGVMGRSNLRAKATVGGYNLVDVRNDSMIFTERRPLLETLKTWTFVKINDRAYDQAKKFPRPDYSVNDSFSFVKEKWRFSAGANIISTPAHSGYYVLVGDQSGKMTCLSAADGKKRWTYQTGGAIFSSPAINAGKVVFGSGDGYVYCLDVEKGKLIWKLKTGASVLGSPLIDGPHIFIGGSDDRFRKIDLYSGKEIWSFAGLEGPMVSKPILYENRIIFGAWDRHLYALDEKTGQLLWKWNNGSSIRNFSPASCIPVASEGVVYIVAPDRYITALDANEGKTLWRNNDATVRESIGISNDGKWIYGKTMQDTIVAYAASREKQKAAWKMHLGFGYEHVPSMLIEKGKHLYFGTKNGVVYAIDPTARQRVWAHKIDHSMVNTVNVISEGELLVSTMDGKLVWLSAVDQSLYK
jgi:outer membrane protein assembly factor BamB/predicted phosphodiesterase